ncbi:hypothetical protein WMY93_006847 [Mugilogobius chulae]|uniref:SUEL-type lectin domain-containing protein n=1 Tax=Mugilogobius chulae TaxID=88201 RepID=A0AAW0PUL1_9GOBI
MLSFVGSICLAAAALQVSAVSSYFPVSTTKVTTCDSLGNVHRLSCDYGVITVQTVLYGRMNKETCSEGWSDNLSDINCSQKDSADVLKKSCDGKTSCEVAVNAFRSSDPCLGTYKYLESTYGCFISAPTPSNQSSVVCEHSTAHLRCDQGQVIRLNSASYGRRDSTTCSAGRPQSQIQNTNCERSVVDKVAPVCNDENSCSVRATNTEFGDPCSGTYKYLHISYTCVTKEPSDLSSVVCEKSTAHLRCGQGQVILVKSAEYGRRNSSTCSAGRPQSQLQNTNCVRSVTDRVKKICNDHSSCFVSASNSDFGDPCYGTYKYLKVEYTCKCLAAAALQVSTASPSSALSTTKVTTCYGEGNLHRLSCGWMN